MSRAADAELAEISLEQQVLREMMLPQQQQRSGQQPADVDSNEDAIQSSSLRLYPAVRSTQSSVTVSAILTLIA